MPSGFRVAFVIVAVLGLLSVPAQPPAPFELLGAPMASAAVIDTVAWNGNRYYLISENTASGAALEAQSLGGRLATITSQEEHDFLWATWGGSLGTGFGLWIGLTDRGTENGFVWLGGEPVTFTNWKSGEPSNGRGQYEEDFVNMDSRFGSDGRWNDVPDAGPGWRPARGIVKVRPADPGPPASAVSVSLRPAAPGTVMIHATGAPAEALRISIDHIAVQTCVGSPCAHPWNPDGLPTPTPTVKARTSDAKGSVVGEAHVTGLLQGFVSLAVPSPASGVVTIQAAVESAWRVDIRIDGTTVKTCSGSACSYAWDTTTAADGPHTISIRGHDGSSDTEASAYVRTTVANNPTTVPSSASSTGLSTGSSSSSTGSTGSSTGPIGPTVCPAGSTPGTTTSESGSGGGYLVDYNVYQVPDIPRPEVCQPMQDPVFGATITRVTDPVMGLGSVRGYRHEYSRLPGLSADNTKAVVVRMRSGTYQVLELTRGQILRSIPNVPCGARDPSISWHRQDPDRLVYFCKNEVRTLRVSTGAVTPLMTFPEYKRVETMEEGTVSDDWGSVALFGIKADDTMEAVVADLQAGTVIARDSSIAFGNWIGISPSGQYVVIQHMGTIGTRVYDRNLTYLRTLHLDAAHEDFAIDEDGQEVLVWFAKTGAQSAPFNGRSVIAKGRLSDGQTTELIDTKWKWGGHLSGIGSRGRPGWILVSDYRAVGAPPNVSPFQREIFWLKMDGSGEVRRLAHHHSDQAQCQKSDGYFSKDYFAEPHAVASWDGTRVLFASTWGDSCTRYDTYTIDSP